MNSTAQQLVVITGASKGLGAALARQFAAAGYPLALIARDQQLLQQLAGELAQQHQAQVGVFAADLTQQDQLQTVYQQIEQQLGPIEILINNAGLGFYKPFLEHSIAEHQAIIDLNFSALVHSCYAVLPGMQQRQRGTILNIASDVSERPQPNMAVYSASKFAVRGFSLSLLREVKQHGIKVTCVNPGIIDTCFNGNVPGNQAASDALQADEVAQLMVQLLQQPAHLLIDEITLHPPSQDF